MSDDAMTDERLAEIDADLSPGGHSHTYESDLLVFDEACELFNEVKRLRSKRVAKRIVDVIVADILDRRGLKWEWAKIAPSVQEEIRATWVNAIQAESQAPRPTSTWDAVVVARKREG